MLYEQDSDDMAAISFAFYDLVLQNVVHSSRITEVEAMLVDEAGVAGCRYLNRCLYDKCLSRCLYDKCLSRCLYDKCWSRWLYDKCLSRWLYCRSWSQ